MWSYLRKGRSLRARNRFSLEHLEVRQLMAADLLSNSSSLFRSPFPSPTNTTQVVATRSIDGTGNNLLNWQWGSTGEELLRAAAAEYGDGISKVGGTDRPREGVVRNEIAA